MSKNKDEQIIEIWKSVVEVQRHFNDIGMRVRGMFVTVILGFFAAMGFLIDKELYIDLYIFQLQFAVFVSVFGIVATYLFYFIDRYWYHRLLIGAVKHGIMIEERHKESLPELSLSEAIGKESPFKPGRIIRCMAKLLVNDKKFVEEGELHSDGKIELFYKSVVLVISVMAIIITISGGIKFGWSDSTPDSIQNVEVDDEE